MRASAYAFRPRPEPGRAGSSSEGEDAWDDDAMSARSGGEQYAGSLGDAEAGDGRRGEAFTLEEVKDGEDGPKRAGIEHGRR